MFDAHNVFDYNYCVFCCRYADMRRVSGRKRKAHVIEDLGGPLRDKASGTRHVAKKKVKRVHGRVIGERAVRAAAKKTV